jgi:uncharacterized protein
MTHLILIALLGLAAGTMIGSLGIGGVALVPALVFLVHVPIQICIPAVMMAYILSGLVASAVFAHNKSIQWSASAWLCAGATPTAFAGAWTANILDARLLELGLGLLTTFAGAASMMIEEKAAGPPPSFPRPILLLLGAVTGFLSSVSGTGGPLVLVPILMSMQMPALVAVGLSQIIQLPIAFSASLANVLYGHIDLVLGGILAAALTVGSWGGAKLAHSMPRAILRTLVSVMLIIVGTSILAKVLWTIAQ